MKQLLRRKELKSSVLVLFPGESVLRLGVLVRGKGLL